MGEIISIRQRRRKQTALHALAPLRLALGRQDKLLRSVYLRRFREAYPDVRRTLAHPQMVERIRRADYLLVGDFHACAAYQHYTATLLSLLAADNRPRALALEFALARDQHLLDLWWERRIGDRELRHRLRFDEEWGFQWGPSIELLHRARDLNVRLLAADCPLRGKGRRISARDRHFAERLTAYKCAHPAAQIVLLVGESHLAPRHLPLQLRAKDAEERKIAIVLQNIDEMCWATRSQPDAEYSDALELEDDVYCVFNCSPFEKYDAYRTQLRRWRSPADRRRQSLATQAYDLIDALLSMLRVEQYADEESDREPKYLVDYYPEVLDCTDAYVGGSFAEQLRTARHGCVYLPQENVLCVRDFNAFGCAAEAARFVRQACARVVRAADQLDVEDRFYREAYEAMIAAVGALLLFPSRLRQSESELMARHAAAFDGDDRDELALTEFLLVHRDHERHRARYPRLPDQVRAMMEASDEQQLRAATDLGALLAADVCAAYYEGLLGRSSLRNLFFRRPRFGYRELYLDVVNRTRVVRGTRRTSFAA